MSRPLIFMFCLVCCGCVAPLAVCGQDTKVVLRGGERGTALEQALTGSVSRKSLLDSARTLAGFGSRQAGSKSAEKAVAFLVKSLEESGLKVAKLLGPRAAAYLVGPCRMTLGPGGQELPGLGPEGRDLPGHVTPRAWSPPCRGMIFALTTNPATANSPQRSGTALLLSVTKSVTSKPTDLETLARRGFAAILVTPEAREAGLPESSTPTGCLLPLPVVDLDAKAVASVREHMETEPRPRFVLEYESRIEKRPTHSVLARLPGKAAGRVIMVSSILAGRKGATDAAGSAAPVAVLMEIARVLGASRKAHASPGGASKELPPLSGDVTFTFWSEEERPFVSWMAEHPDEATRLGQILVAGPMGRDPLYREICVAGPAEHPAVRAVSEYRGASGFWRKWSRVPASPGVFHETQRYAAPHFLLRDRAWVFYSSSPRLSHLDTKGLDGAALQRGARAMLLGILRLGR